MDKLTSMKNFIEIKVQQVQQGNRVRSVVKLIGLTLCDKCELHSICHLQVPQRMSFTVEFISKSMQEFSFHFISRYDTMRHVCPATAVLSAVPQLDKPPSDRRERNGVSSVLEFHVCPGISLLCILL